MIEVENLSKSFGEVLAVNKISFKVDKGQVVGFLGANGAGKTTTMDIICGCLGADDGSVKICGTDILEDPLGAKKKIGYLPDTPPLYNDMIVKDIITFSAKLNLIKPSEVDDRVEKVMQDLELTGVAKRLTGNLSKGYRQRVALANALVHNPEVLILDEPTEGLDPNQIAQMRDLLNSIKENHTILLSSHILHEIENICDSLVIINEGKVVAEDSYENLANKFSANTYTLKVRSNEQKAAEMIDRLVGVSHTEIDDQGVISFSLDDEAQIDNVAEFVIKESFGLRSLGPNYSNLENIFQELTR